MTDHTGQTPTTNPPGSIAWAEKYLTDTTCDAVDRPLDPDTDFEAVPIGDVIDHLRTLGYIDYEETCAFDVERAVERFQRDVGLPKPFHGYGKIGPRTLSWLEIHAAIHAYDEIHGQDGDEELEAAKVRLEDEEPKVADTAPMATAVPTAKGAGDRPSFSSVLLAAFLAVAALLVFALDAFRPVSLSIDFVIPPGAIAKLLAGAFVVRLFLDVIHLRRLISGGTPRRGDRALA